MAREKNGQPKKKTPFKSNKIEMIFCKKTYKFTRGLLKQIKRLQMTTDLCIPKLSFSRLVREILQKYAIEFKLQGECLLALQEAAEAYMVQLFEDANMCAMHAKRITLKPIDVKLCMSLRKVDDPGRM